LLYLQTKKEVHFMFEEELLDKIYQGVSKRLRAANESRTFYTQSVLVGHNAPSNDVFGYVEGVSAVDDNCEGGGDASKKRKKREDHNADVTEPSLEIDLGDEEDHEDIECDLDSALANGDGADERYTATRHHERDVTPSQGARNRNFQRTDLPPPMLNTHSSSSAPPKQGSKLVRTDPGLARIDAFFLPSVDSIPVKSHVSNLINLTTAYCGVCSTPGVTKSKAVVKGRRDLMQSAVDGVDEEVILVDTILGCQCCNNGSDVGGKRKNRSELINSNMAQLLNSKDDKYDDKDATSSGRPKMTKFTETKCLYASVQSLLLEICNDRHEGLENILKKNSYVGVIDSTYCSVQFGTKLLLLDYSVLSFHLFYQLSIRRFAECSRIILGTPVDIKEYVMTALDSPEGGWREELGPKVRTAECVVKILKQNCDMLDEYFKIGVNEDGYLCTIPDLLPGYLPSPLGLPLFLLRLVTETDWEDEISCFRSIATELGRFYSALHTDTDCSGVERSAESGVVSTQADGTTASVTSAKRNADHDTLPSLLLSAIRVHLIAPKVCAEDSTTIVQIAALEQLYKVFERC
jgi:DNA mismatch repair protein Mlh1 C-terminus